MARRFILAAMLLLAACDDSSVNQVSVPPANNVVDAGNDVVDAPPDNTVVESPPGETGMNNQVEIPPPPVSLSKPLKWGDDVVAVLDCDHKLVVGARYALMGAYNKDDKPGAIFNPDTAYGVLLQPYPPDQKLWGANFPSTLWVSRSCVQHFEE